jgi:exoribonuclease II
VYLFFLLRLNGVEDEIAELDQQIAEQNQRLTELAPYRDLQARLDAKKPVADGIFRTRFPWDEFLQGLAFVIPQTTALDTFTVDPATARDFDDAVSAQPEGDGVRLWIHIADVAAHVRAGSGLDEEAFRRAEEDVGHLLALTGGDPREVLDLCCGEAHGVPPSASSTLRAY